jgi:hypothetical protein
MTVGDQTASPAAAAPRSLPQLRRATLDDYSHIRRLESEHGLLSLPEKAWRNIWLDNPLRQRVGDDFPVGWLLVNEANEVVGSMANIPTLYTFKGTERVAATGRGWVVRADYRGVALWLMDEYFNQDGVDLFINTTVNSMAVEPFSAFGCSRVPLGDWETAAYWVTGYRGFARSALRIKGVPMPGLLAPAAAIALRLKELACTRPPSAAANGATVEEVKEFDARFDAFWEELVCQTPSKLLAVRDSRTLSWHFADPLRSGQATILTASRGGLLRAYCILKRQDHPPSGLRRLRLVDYQNLDKEDLLAALIQAALEQCKRSEVYTFEHVCGGLPKMQSFDTHAPYRRKLPAWPYYYKATDPALDADLKRPEAWDPSTYDGDASL